MIFDGGIACRTDFTNMFLQSLYSLHRTEGSVQVFDGYDRFHNSPLG